MTIILGRNVFEVFVVPRMAGWLRRTTSGEYGVNDNERDAKGTSYADLEGATASERLDEAARRVDRMLRELQQFGETIAPAPPHDEQPFPATIGSTRSMFRPGSSACHTEYDNDSDAGGGTSSRSSRPTKRQTRAALAARTRRLRDASVSSIELEPLHKHWRSGYSIGYEDEYERVMTGSEMETEDEALPGLPGPSRQQNDPNGEELGLNFPSSFHEAEQLPALSHDIRRNFGDFQLASFDDQDV